jgi:hypothetical protein
MVTRVRCSRRRIGAAGIGLVLGPWLASAAAFADDGVADQPSATSSPSPSAAPRSATDPAVSFADDCVRGITVTLSNMSLDNTTTDPVTFNVMTPSGATRQVTVRADQLVRLAFAVKEDKTATVRVSAAGMSPRSHSYAKDCTHVLGEKFVHHAPPAQTATTAGAGAVAPAAGPQLPFTGLPTGPAVALGGALIALGATLERAGRRRTVAPTLR